MKTVTLLTVKKWAEKAKREIKANPFMTLATSSGNQPWNTPVYCAFDKNYNFFWNSYPGSQHSRNIMENGKAFVVIYNRLEVGFGVYMQGTAERLIYEKDIKNALELLWKRKGENYTDVKAFTGSVPYRFVPKRFWVNDETYLNGKKIDIKIEITRYMKKS